MDILTKADGLVSHLSFLGKFLEISVEMTPKNNEISIRKSNEKGKPVGRLNLRIIWLFWLLFFLRNLTIVWVP